jgi:hypothetical protein
MKMSLEDAEYTIFKTKVREGKYKDQRIGQAFYNHFNLHKLRDQKSLKNLYELDGGPAIILINTLFSFT